MTQNQIQILRLTTVGVDYFNLSDESKEILNYLSSIEKLCEQKSLSDTVYYINQKGLSLLSSIENADKERAETEKQRRYENKISAAGIFANIAVFFVGLIVEHFTGIFQAALSAFI